MGMAVSFGALGVPIPELRGVTEYHARLWCSGRRDATLGMNRWKSLRTKACF